MNDQELDQLLERYRTARLAAKHLTQVQKTREQETGRLQRLEAQLDKEYLDYVRLKNFSIRGLFLKLLGNKDQQLDIEYQEYLHATLQYNECLKSLELLDFEENVLQEKVANLEKMRLQIEQLLTVRNSQLSQKYPRLYREIKRIERSKTKMVELKREIHEALIIAARSRYVIQQMMDLIQAEISSDLAWGNFSNLGSSSDFTSRGRMDQVVDLSFQLKNHFKSLQVELDDVYRMKSVTRFDSLYDLERLNEIFYDRLVSDWILSQGLSSTFQTLRHASDSIRRIMVTLKNQQGITDQQLKYLDTKLDDLLLE